MCETDVTNVCGFRSRSILYRVPFPTPDGPEMTIGRVSDGGESLCAVVVYVS